MPMTIHNPVTPEYFGLKRKFQSGNPGADIEQALADLKTLPVSLIVSPAKWTAKRAVLLQNCSMANMIGNTQGKDVPGTSSNAQSSTSIVAGVVVSGSGATATFHNQNQSIVGLDTKPGATATPTSSNVAGGIVASHHGRVTINHIYPPPVDVNADDQIPALLKVIHQNTWEKTAVDIGDSFKSDRFPEPNFEVHPQMVESLHFYQGGHPEPIAENDPTPPPAKRKRVKVKQPKYKKDYRFTFDKPNVSSHRPLSIESLMKKIHEKKKDKLGVLGIVAQAGAGKTTCMRRWARHTMTRSGMSTENQFTPDKESRFQMIHFLDMKGIPMSEISSLQEFLFKDLFKDKKHMEDVYEWLFNNQNKVAIFLDGLDQAQQEIKEKDVEAVGKYGKAKCPQLLCNLLTRNLLPGVRIIMSSREYAVASLPEEAWIRDVITLTGFTEDDAKKLFNAVTIPNDDSISTEEGDDASKDQNSSKSTSLKSCIPNCTELVKSDSCITGTFSETASAQDRLQSNWDKLTKTSSSLLTFISIPIFLMFTAIVFHEFGQTPSSVTELLIKVFETLHASVVIQKRKTLSTIIQKLKRLSHTGMEKGFVIFSSDDLKSHGLSVDDVQDLLLMVPRSRSLSHRLIEGDNVFFFCHQILQEFLSACFVVEMTLQNFREFVKTNLERNHWSVVQRFVCGLLFSSSGELDKLLQISDKDKKQYILRQSLAELLDWRSDLELLAAIYESNDDSVIRLITKIKIDENVIYCPLSSDGAHLIGSIMARCKKLELLEIVNSDLDNNLLRIMAKSIGYPKIHVHEITFTDECSINFAALNDFLEHIDSDLVNVVDNEEIPRDLKEDRQCCEFDWSNIRQFCISCSTWLLEEPLYINFRNTDDSIMLTINREQEIQEEEYGSYNKMSKTLTVTLKEGLSDVIHCVALAVQWLNRCSVSLDIKGNPCMQYLCCESLTYLADSDITRITKIESILLDSTDFKESSNLEKFDRDITSIVKKFQVKVMDLVIPFQQIGDMMDKLVPLLRLHDCKLRIHVVLWDLRGVYVESEDSKKQFAILKRTKIESFRLMSYSLGDLAPWIQNLSEAKVKQFVIVHMNGSEADREKVKCEERSHEIELTYLHSDDLDHNDPWRRIYW